MIQKELENPLYKQDSFTFSIMTHDSNKPIPYKPALNILNTPELSPVNNQENAWQLEHQEPPLLDILPPNLELNETKKGHQRQISAASLAPSSIYSTHQHQQHATSTRHSKASFSLTHHPDALKLYREMALKTGDTTVQLTYAKYLLEIASMNDDTKHPFKPNLSLSLSRLPRDSFSSNLTSDNQFNHVTRPFYFEDDEQSHTIDRKKKKLLEEEGVRWIKRLANARVGEAAYLLGLWYDRGMYGFRKSATRALKFYKIAAKDKVPEAMFAVGQYREKNQDYMTSFQLYEEAASLGLVEALYRIAMIYLNGEFGSRKNIPAAIQLLIKASEQSTGTCPEAPYTLGILLLNQYPSITIPNEIIQQYGGVFAAMTYLEYAAEMNMPLAHFRLGNIYEKGLYSIRVDLAKARTHYERATSLSKSRPGKHR